MNRVYVCAQVSPAHGQCGSAAAGKVTTNVRPTANPAQVKSGAGSYAANLPKWLRPYRPSAERTLVVHGLDGLDELPPPARPKLQN